jgi:hypothetical protein
MLALLIALALSAPPPCGNQLDDCVVSCQGAKSQDSMCHDSVTKTYDQCSYYCKMKFPGAEGYVPCAAKCDDTKAKGEKGCYDRKSECMSNCLAKPYNKKPCTQ